MNNTSNRRIEMVINIKEVLWDLLEQWKAVLITALVMALLVAGVKYAKDMKAYNSAQIAKEAEKKNTAPAEKRIEDILETLPEDERSTVMTIINQNKWIAAQKEYISKSILLNTDPTNQRTLVADYYITTTEDSDNLSASLIYGYRALLKNKETIRKIGEAIDPGVEESYIAELISVDETDKETSVQTTDAVMEVRIVLPENADSGKVEEALAAVLQGLSSGLSGKIAPHRLTLLNVSENYLYNDNAVNNRTNILYGINNLQNNSKNMKSSLTDGQTAAVEAITAINEAENGAADETSGEASPNTIERKPGFSKIFALLGFILGVMMYAFTYILIIIMRGRVNYAEDVERYAQARLLGEVYHQKDHKGLDALLHSRLVDKYRYRDRLDEDSQTRKAVSKLDAVCKHAGIKGVSVLCMTEMSEENNKIVDAIKNKGLNVSVTEIKKQPDEEYFLSLKDTVLFAGNDITVKDLVEETSQLSGYDVKLLGSIYCGCI